MKQDWEHLEAWLQAHEAKTLADLNPPATTAEIKDLERKLGYRVPSDYLQCLQLHAGQQGKAKWLFDGMEFLSIPNVVLSWEAWNDLAKDGDLDGLKSKPSEGIQPIWWSRSWIPFASNGGGDFLCLDMAPDTSGQLGQVIKIFHDFPNRELVSPNLNSWFKNFIDSKII